MLALVRKLEPYSWAAMLTVGAVVGLVWAQPHANLTTTALVLVLVVTVSAIAWGSGPALLTALLSVFCFNYFFIPPIHTFTIADPQNWIAFSAFVGTALAVGQLSSRARKRAKEAEARRIEIERLYQQLQKAFEKASQAETLRRSEQLKNALLDAVTHDLRTPLTSIKASVTTLLGGGRNGQGTESLSSDGQRELLEVINEESDRLNHFVEQMMTLAQLEGGQLLLHPSEMSAQDIIQIATDRATSLLRQRSVEVTVADHLPPLTVDGSSVAGMIYELLVNAVKYSPHGSAIHMTAQQISPIEAEIAVRNEGPELPLSVRQRVFEKFYRGPEQQEEREGFGLGLSIARGIVEAHGGRIWMDAGPGGSGAIVRFTLPCAGSNTGERICLPAFPA